MFIRAFNNIKNRLLKKMNNFLNIKEFIKENSGTIDINCLVISDHSF